MIREEGYKFQFDPLACNSCEAQCCSGDSGNIFFSKEEQREISKFLSISEKEFLEIYTRKEGYRYSIKELKIGGKYLCVFLENGKCSIYPVRPQQCRTFPFWKEFQKDENLELLKKECIGVIVTS